MSGVNVPEDARNAYFVFNPPSIPLQITKGGIRYRYYNLDLLSNRLLLLFF